MQNRHIPRPISGTVLDAVKVNNLEDISNQDIDSNAVECKESFVCFILNI